MLNPYSYLALAIMLAAIVAGLSKRVLASGALVVANVIVYLLTRFGPMRDGVLGGPSVGHDFVIHAELALYTPNLVNLPLVGAMQVFSSLFVHYDIWHLVGNMIALVAFGFPFEQRIGPRKFIAIYLLGGLGATLVQVAADWGNPTFLMGASGCIFAILGAFAIRYPNQVVPVPLFFFVLPMRVVVGAMAYIAFQLVYLAMNHDVPGLGGTAYYAHLGGAAVGVLLGLALVRPAKQKGPIAVDLQALAPFARDPTTKKVWDHMLGNHDEPAVFQAWLDRFFRTATCPTCGHRVAPRAAGQVVCVQNHKFDVRKGLPPAPATSPSPPPPPVRQG